MESCTLDLKLNKFFCQNINLQDRTTTCPAVSHLCQPCMLWTASIIIISRAAAALINASVQMMRIRGADLLYLHVWLPSDKMGLFIRNRVLWGEHSSILSPSPSVLLVF